MISRLRRVAWGPLALLALLAVAVGCEEAADPGLAVDIGVAVMALLDSSLRVQAVPPPSEQTLQVTRWHVEHALLTVGQNTVDILFPGDDPAASTACVFTDSAIALSPVAEGKCASGIVLGATEGPIEVSLQLRVRPSFVRAEPAPLASFPDYDNDGVPNDVDVCPLVPDNQADDDRDGIGNACSLFDPATGQPGRDSDADGVLDRIDNCVWRPNPDQLNTRGIGTEAGLPDGIGDACSEQTAEAAGGTIELFLGPIPFEQPFAAGSFLVVDFRSEESLTRCTWPESGPGVGICEVDPSAVRFCTSTSSLILLTGCPG